MVSKREKVGKEREQRVDNREQKRNRLSITGNQTTRTETMYRGRPTVLLSRIKEFY